MAFPTSVNSQITDAVTQANVKVLGDAPAMAMANLYQSLGTAMTSMTDSGVSAQQQSNVTAQAATTMGVSTLYAIDTASTAVATSRVLNTTDDMVVGHINSSLYSPQGKKNVQQALEQAQASLWTDDSQATIDRWRKEVTEIIRAAIAQGVSKQAIAYTLYEVQHERGINSLYPSAHAPDLTEQEIQAYYKAMIASVQGK